MGRSNLTGYPQSGLTSSRPNSCPIGLFGPENVGASPVFAISRFRLWRILESLFSIVDRSKNGAVEE